MKKIFSTGLFLCFSVNLYAGNNITPLVDNNWVKQNGCKEGVVMLDIRSEKIDGQGKADYLKGHIPCAIHSDYIKAKWRVKSNKVPGMLPPVNKLEETAANLGINNDTHVVLIPFGSNAISIGSATRLFWTFKVLGHDKVSILNGGHKGYSKVKENRLAKEDYMPAAKGNFKAAVRKDMLVNARDVKAAMAANVSMIDNRSPDQYLGVNKSSKVKKHGTLAGAYNLPTQWMTKNNGGAFRSVDGVKEAYGLKKVPTNGKQINFCNTGHLASVGWFVASELLGNKDSLMYDGSIAEWSRNEGLTMDRKIAMKD